MPKDSLQYGAKVRTASQIHVLLVDDEQSFIEVSKTILESEGPFLIQTAASVDEASTKLLQSTFDVIVSDYEMPHKNGLDFLKSLRESGSDIPFILFTGKGREEIVVQALNLGADRYVNKHGAPETVYTELSVSIRQLHEKAFAQRMLWESEERFEKMVTNSKDVIMLTQTDGIILYISPSSKDVLGYEPNELIGKSPWIIHPEDSERAQKMFHAALTTKLNGTADYRIITKQGETRWVSHSFSQIIEKGIIKQVVSTVKDITEAKKAQAKLSESEEHFRLAVKNSPIMMATLNSKLEYIWYYNTRFLTGTDFIGKGFGTILPIDDIENLRLALFDVMKTGCSLRREVNIHLKDGTLVLDAFFESYPNEQGENVGVSFVAYDITGRKLAESVLLESEAKFSAAFYSSGAALSITGLTDGFIVEINDSFIKMFGYTRDEVIGKTVLELGFYANAKDREEIVDLIRANQPVINRELKGRKKDGTEITALLSTKNIDIKGKRHLLTSLIDISALKRTEQALFIRQKELETFISTAPDAIAIFDTTGKVINCNEMTLEILGYTREEVIGRYVYEFFSETDREKLARNIQEALNQKQISDTLIALRKNGEKFGLEGSMKAVFDETGRPTALIAIVRDITDKIEKEQKIINLLTESEQRSSSLRELLAVSQMVLRNNDMQTILKHILNAFEKIVHAESGIIFLMQSPYTKEIALFHHKGQLEIKSIPEYLIPVCKEVCLENKAVFINDLQQSKYPNLRKIPHTMPKNAAFVPLKIKQQVVGYIVLANKKGDFNDNEMLFGTLLAEFAQIALENIAAMQAIGDSEMQVRAITDSAKDAIVMINAEGNVTFWSPAAENLFGYTFNEVSGKNFHKMVLPPNYYSASLERFHEFKKNGFGVTGGKTLEVIATTKSGRTFPAEISLSPLKSVDKFSVIGIIRDVTDRKIAEQKLRESEERYRFVAENVQDVLLVTDENGTFLYASQSIKNIIGLSPEDLVGKKSVLEFLPPEDIDKFNPKMQQLVETGKIIPLEFRFPRADGECVWLEAKISVVHSQTDGLRFISVARDITQRKKDQEQLDKALGQAELLLEKLSVVGGFVRHDIRNKLSVITNILYLAKKYSKENQQMQSQLEQISEVIKKITRMLDFAHTYELVGSQGLFWINAHRSIMETQELFSNLNNIKVEVSDLDVELLADSALVQIFHNLIDNSLKHGVNLSKIKIYSALESDNLKIIYEDDGGGIDPKIKPCLFQKGAGKGTGLGLYLIQQICDIYGWTVKEDGDLGKGVRFQLTIPQKLTLTHKNNQ